MRADFTPTLTNLLGLRYRGKAHRLHTVQHAPVISVLRMEEIRTSANMSELMFIKRSVAGVSSITSYFQKPRPKRVESVVEAEVKFGYFLAEHHLAFSVADHCSKLFPSLFPDSAIAKAFKCGRTKATAIVKVLAEEVMKEVICRLE